MRYKRIANLNWTDDWFRVMSMALVAKCGMGARVAARRHAIHKITANVNCKYVFFFFYCYYRFMRWNWTWMRYANETIRIVCKQRRRRRERRRSGGGGKQRKKQKAIEKWNEMQMAYDIWWHMHYARCMCAVGTSPLCPLCRHRRRCSSSFAIHRAIIMINTVSEVIFSFCSRRLLLAAHTHASASALGSAQNE